MNNVLNKVFAGLIGAATTFLIQKSIETSWVAITGEEPPDPTDPEVPTAVAVSWAVASAIGLTVSQLLVNRLTANRLNADKMAKVKVKLD